MLERVVKLFEERSFTDVQVDQKNGTCTVSGFAPGRVTEWPLDRTLAFKDRLKKELPSAQAIGADYKPVDGDYRVKFSVVMPAEASETEKSLSS